MFAVDRDVVSGIDNDLWQRSCSSAIIAAFGTALLVFMGRGEKPYLKSYVISVPLGGEGFEGELVVWRGEGKHFIGFLRVSSNNASASPR